MSHPSLDITGSSGAELEGKRLILCVAGSVAAYKAIELARLLMRHGADVTCVESPAAARLIRPAYLKWATGNDVITRLTGDLEHIRLADYGKSDAIIVYPGTANTLGKLACGIDDTPISTILTVGFGAKIPIVMCLAMHAAMYENASVKRNIRFLKNRVAFLDPQITEGKAKAPEPEDVLHHMLERFGRSGVLAGRRVLMTAGPTTEHIDPVRVITNLSTGLTGTLLAQRLVSAGSYVTMIYGPGSAEPPRGASVIRVSSYQDMASALQKQLRKKWDVVIMAAAVSDYAPKAKKKKIESADAEIQVTLRRTPKLLPGVRKSQKDAVIVGFKAEADVSEAVMMRRARKRMAEAGADIMVANDIGTKYRKDPAKNSVIILDRDSATPSGRRPKREIAEIILDKIKEKIAEK